MGEQQFNIDNSSCMFEAIVAGNITVEDFNNWVEYIKTKSFNEAQTKIYNTLVRNTST
jgi:hypothetical protein